MSALIRYASLARLRLVLGLALVGLVFAPSASGAAAPLDTVTAFGSGLHFAELNVSAQSGPSGENPSGTAGFILALPPVFSPVLIAGAVTCLNVNGHTAVVNLRDQATSEIWTLALVDNGGNGTISTDFGRAPTDCSRIANGTPETMRDGSRVTVFDALSVTTVFPADGATGVGAGTPVLAVFDAPMDHASTAAAFTLKRTSDNSPVAGKVGWYYGVPIFVPSSPLAPSTQYTATISTAATDQNGFNLGSPKTWSFNTEPAPTATFMYPSAGASGVYPNVPVLAVFSTAMDQASTAAAFTLKRTSDNTPVAGKVVWYYGVPIFVPSGDLGTGVQYTATISTAAKDQKGTPLAAPVSWQFTTINQPIIDSVYPAAGATGVATSSPVVAIFSEAMDHASTQAAFTLKRTSDNSPVAGSVIWYYGVPIFIPSSALAPNTAYTATIAGTATDQSGRTLANPTSWVFTTGSTASASVARAFRWSSPSPSHPLSAAHHTRRPPRLNPSHRPIPHPISESLRQLERRLQNFATHARHRQ